MAGWTIRKLITPFCHKRTHCDLRIGAVACEKTASLLFLRSADMSGVKEAELVDKFAPHKNEQKPKGKEGKEWIGTVRV